MTSRPAIQNFAFGTCKSHDAHWTNRLDRWAEPSRDSRERVLPAADIFKRVLAELERCAGGPLGKRRDQLVFRDTLIVAILATCPVRLRNLAMMEIGTHLDRIGPEWHLRFEASETKTGQPIHLVIPIELDPFLALFLEKVRPAFPGTADTNLLWPAGKGKTTRSSTLRSESGKRTYIITARRMISGDVLKYRNGLVIRKQLSGNQLHLKPV